MKKKADVSNVLTKDQTEEYTPTGEYNPATKKYVDDKVFETGAADMRKAVYDTDGNGIVDNAERLAGQLPSAFATAKQGELADAAMPKAGGTFTGAAVGMTSPDAAAQFRNVVVVDAGTDLASLSVPAGTIIMMRK